MPEGQTPLFPQYSFHIWLRNWFPVHYFHPVVFNWLGYKPSKWCNLIPQASAEVITATREWIISLSLDDQKIFSNIDGSISQCILNQRVKNFWFMNFSQSSADRLIVVVPDNLIYLSHLWVVDLINHFEVMQRQKGWKFMAINRPAFLSCFGAFDTSSGTSYGSQYEVDGTQLINVSPWFLWCHLIQKGKSSQIEQG